MSVSGGNLVEKNHPDGLRKSASCDLSQSKEKQVGESDKSAGEGDKECGGLASGGNGKETGDKDKEHEDLTSGGNEKAAEESDNEQGGLILAVTDKDSDEREQQKVQPGATDNQKLADENVGQNKKEDNHIQNS